MADLVIKISEEDYERLKEYKKAPFNSLTSRVYEAIANGTPLPKGHGKLIAEPTEDDIAEAIGGQNDFAECIRDAVKAVFDNATAIIEADAPKRGKHLVFYKGVKLEGTPLEENDSGYNCEDWIP